jgi:hypothetical protein
LPAAPPPNTNTSRPDSTSVAISMLASWSPSLEPTMKRRAM